MLKRHVAQSKIPVTRSLRPALLILPATLCAQVFGAPATALMDDFTPLSKSDRAKKFQLKTIKHADEQLKQNRRVAAGGFALSLSQDGAYLNISPTRPGHRWKIQKQYFGLGTLAFTADLDRNGKADLILLQSTGACGIAPPSALTTVMIDAQNKPHIMEVRGYFAIDQAVWDSPTDNAYIDDLLDLNQDGKAELVTEQLDYAMVNGKQRSYWRTVIYKAGQAGWHKMPSYRGMPAPLLVAYKFRPNHVVVRQPAKNLLAFDDGSSSAALVTGTIGAAAVDEQGRLQELQINTGGKSVRFKTYDFDDYFVPFLRYESGGTSEILASGSQRAGAVLQEAARKRASVKFSPRTLPGHMPLLIVLKGSFEPGAPASANCDHSETQH